MSGHPSWQELQASAHGEQHDYQRDSPHLSHGHLRQMIGAEIAAAVTDITAARGACRVLEVGAGHGTFTTYALEAGAEVTVTEMSAASAERLAEKFADDPRVTVLHDKDGRAAFRGDDRYDLILVISVLHHIPDYLTFIADSITLLNPGGAFVTFQDPLWYPRRSRWSMRAQNWAYYAWRIGQGSLRAGLATRIRRHRGVIDESLEADMVEYHVVRDGVDEHAITELLRTHFGAVRQPTYWATQATPLQRLGDKLGWKSHFGAVATGKLTEARTG